MELKGKCLDKTVGQGIRFLLTGGLRVNTDNRLRIGLPKVDPRLLKINFTPSMVVIRSFSNCLATRANAASTSAWGSSSAFFLAMK
jgi:hypothetical protein